MARKPAHRSKAGSTEDVALICGVGANGSDLHVLRRRNNRIETGVARALREGQPIQGELVRLRPREQFPLLCDVDVELANPEQAQASDDVQTREFDPRNGPTHGPAQVSNDSYRKNWDAIWKRSSTAKKMVN
ncbi:MAG TPA: hypothetical protein VHO25_14860 [Polyangiaceae bacterium]|nr:hypothetical protein [Polyangiaceae bacterium]